MYQLGMIFGMAALAPRLGVYGLAWGVVIGAALHLLLQIPSLLQQKGQYFATFGLDLPAVRQVIRLMGPRLLGVAVVQINFWVNTYLASFMPEGSVIAVTLAFALMLMPQAAIAQSIAIAAMPTFSAQAARGRFDELRASLAASLRSVLLLAAPASLGLILLRQPLVAALYQHGEFTIHSTELVAWALLWYAAGLIEHSLLEVLVRAFYSLQDTKTPVIVGAAAMSLNVVFSFTFSALFTRLGWMPHGGLALANSLATALEVTILLMLIRRRVGGLDGRRVLAGGAQALVTALAMGAALWGWLGLTAGRPDWLRLGGGVIIGAGLYGLGALALGIPEARGLLHSLYLRLAKKKGEAQS
jgi:putative peptidoglycan lipid II flippase